ncbi:MAG TPA: sugar phosphate isomerase/epimerase family protein [Methanoregulaceae archaeon]|nr:sugar phosphate isomerase/epimerase family protein [Methanoregulaceae archaeon]HRY76514.1 sugar phosphate isomerase/epimerase family protein [Methanoregulaceae archaeon]
MVGVSTYCLLHKPLPDALDELAAITGLIEVMDEGPHFITDPALFESYSCAFMLHAPYHGINIASLREPIRRASVEVMTDCLAVAAEIGAGVVMHPGYYSWVQEREAADRQFKKSLGEIRAAAADRGARFSFENMGDMNYFNLRTPDDLGLIGECGFTLDCGHANVNGCLPGFLKEEFSHMHLHDNDGRRDSHSPVGDGSIDFAKVMQALRRNHATAVIEVKSLAGVTSSLAALERT